MDQGEWRRLDGKEAARQEEVVTSGGMRTRMAPASVQREMPMSEPRSRPTFAASRRIVWFAVWMLAFAGCSKKDNDDDGDKGIPDEPLPTVQPLTPEQYEKLIADL